MTDTETKPNAELAYKALDLINEHRDHFDMAVWASPGKERHAVGIEELTDPNLCGTTACFAGWVVALSGYRVGYGGYVYDAQGNSVDKDAPDLAAELLNLDGGGQADIFYGEDEYIADDVESWFGPRPGAES